MVAPHLKRYHPTCLELLFYVAVAFVALIWMAWLAKNS